MAWIVGTNTAVYVCSTEVVATEVAYSLYGEGGHGQIRIFEMPAMKLHVDFGGMISVRGTPKLYVDHEDGEFNYYAHQRAGVKSQLDQVMAAGDRSLHDVVQIKSANHTLCITLDHAMTILVEMDTEVAKEIERSALEVCERMVSALRGSRSPYMQLSKEHDLEMN